MTKLNSFILSDNIVRKMKEELVRSKDKNLEFGFVLCTKPDSNIIIDGQHYKGTESRITIKRQCGINEKIVGAYHTHPLDRVVE